MSAAKLRHDPERLGKTWRAQSSIPRTGLEPDYPNSFAIFSASFGTTMGWLP